MSDSLVDSIGVNTHLGETTSVYYTNFPAAVNAISTLGVRHIRANYWFKEGSDRALSLISQVKSNTGVDLKFLLGQNFICDIQSDQVRPQKYLEWGWSVNNISGFEGLNEPQHWCTDWVTTTRNAQRYIWSAVKGNPQLAHLPVVGPSLYTAGGQTQTTNDANALGDLTPYLDYGNVHIYTTDSHPSSSWWLPLPAQSAISGTKKHFVTETGWPQCNIEMSKANRYYSRVFFGYFNAGHERTYAYELMDTPHKTDCEGTFGLVYGDGRPKPLFNTIKNIITLLKDPGPSFTPGSLNFTLSSSNSRLHKTLLQKRDGRYYLALWFEYSSWENFVPQYVTINFPSAMAQVQKFDPLSSVTPQQAMTNVSNYTLSITDQLVLVEITPSATPAPVYHLSISSPAQGATVSGTIQIQGAAQGFQNVEVFNSAGVMLSRATLSSGNYVASIDTRSLANGSQSLNVIAWDSAPGQPFTEQASQSVNLNIQNLTAPSPSDTTAPSISIASPLAESSFSPRSVISVSASAADNVGVVDVRFYLNGSLICVDSSAAYQCSMRLSKKHQTHTIEVQARDAAGNIGRQSIQIYTR